MQPTLPRPAGRSRRQPALVVALAGLACVIAASFPEAQSKSAVPGKPSDQTIVHVLNRLGFGPRPGDVDRVKAMGLSAYIDQQLNPDRIDNRELDDRLATLTTLNKSQRELSDDYFMPLQEMRRDQQLKQQRAEI